MLRVVTDIDAGTEAGDLITITIFLAGAPQTNTAGRTANIAAAAVEWIRIGVDTRAVAVQFARPTGGAAITPTAGPAGGTDVAAATTVIGVVRHINTAIPALLGPPGAVVQATAIAANLSRRAAVTAAATEIGIVQGIDTAAGTVGHFGRTAACSAGAMQTNVRSGAGQTTAPAVVGVIVGVDAGTRATRVACPADLNTAATVSGI